MTGTSLLTWLDARDRTLLTRWAVPAHAPARVQRFWSSLTHLGGATATIVACLLPMALGGAVGGAARDGVAILVLSHLMVQVVKRSIGRPRPTCGVVPYALVAEPDRFSFPSGHAAAAMSVALAYGSAFPVLAAPLVLLAALVGASRVCLGVHYPGDVVTGQLLALAAGAIVHAV